MGENGGPQGDSDPSLLVEEGMVRVERKEVEGSTKIWAAAINTLIGDSTCTAPRMFCIVISRVNNFWPLSLRRHGSVGLQFYHSRSNPVRGLEFELECPHLTQLHKCCFWG